ncbi:probable hexokinase-like 2 protein [Phtheirospermum japonicum]|uniref:Phosphotransferase n=1 Tax=Phtheirospermum japonicum TaxID=374723 RepID=A0A830AXU1_9LAMI|nr:probable hexokinase-like 2 protein [Phtheirospermum japonicum]
MFLISPLIWHDSEEKGTFYGINLRGTDIVIVRARLEGKNESVSELRRQQLQIPSSIMANAASTKELCNFAALELAKFISLHSETDSDKSSKGRTLGFTISYPTDQNPASSDIDVKWNNLLVDDTVGKEFANEINQALEKHGVDMRVSAVVKDTIGHLAGGQYYNKESVAAVSLETGTDVAYIQSPQHTPTNNKLSAEAVSQVFIMQWGNFSSTHLPLTEYDVALNADSTNPGERIFEKLISGMYLGEIVRRVLLKMAQETALFGNSVPPKLATPYILKPFDMAAMHQDTSEDYEIVDDKLKQIFEINISTPMVREIVAEVCDVVTERGARLVGAGIVGILKKLDRIKTRKSAVTVEGGLYEHYRIFRNYLHSSVWEMLGSDLSDNVVIEHCHGGSVAGSIFLAALQMRDANP